MSVLVIDQRLLGLEGGLLANVAAERFLVGVDPEVGREVALVDEPLAAHVAGDGIVAGVSGHVLVQADLGLERLAAAVHGALERGDVEVGVAVDFQLGSR